MSSAGLCSSDLSISEVWPTLEDAFGDYAERMNKIPKHVASRTLTEVTWNATLLGDAGGSFSRTLLENRLVDEYLFWLFPVVAGSGARLYDGIDTTEFDLVDLKRLDNGVLGLTYVPAVR